MKKIRKILIVISIVVLSLGILFAIGTVNELIDGMDNNDIYVDGTNFSEISKIFGNFGSIIIGILIFFCSLFIDIILWLVYGTIIIVLKIIKRVKSKSSNK